MIGFAWSHGYLKDEKICLCNAWTLPFSLLLNFFYSIFFSCLFSFAKKVACTVWQKKTRLSCFIVKTNCFILEFWKIYFRLKMIFFVKKSFSEKKILVKKDCWSKRIFDKKKFWLKKNFGVKKFRWKKNFGEKISSQKKKSFVKKIWSKNFFVKKNFQRKKNLVKHNSGQNSFWS